jgi:hypothetical protein
MAFVPSGGANLNDGAPDDWRPTGHGPGLRDQTMLTAPKGYYPVAAG